MAGISNDASLRGKVRAVAKKNGLRAQEVLQMYLFEHLLLRLDWSSIGAPAPSRASRPRGNTAADPGRLPAGDSPGRVPSTWQETAVPSRAAQGRGPWPRWAPCARAGTCPGTPRRPSRTPRASRPRTRARRGSPGRPPRARGHPSRPMVLRERVRPQDPRDRPCDPSPSRPSHARCVPPHLGHAPGSPPALPGPSGTCALRGPVSLPLSPCARPPRPSRHHARHPASPLDMSSR